MIFQLIILRLCLFVRIEQDLQKLPDSRCNCNNWSQDYSQSVAIKQRVGAGCLIWCDVDGVRVLRISDVFQVVGVNFFRHTSHGFWSAVTKMLAPKFLYIKINRLIYANCCRLYCKKRGMLLFRAYTCVASLQTDKERSFSSQLHTVISQSRNALLRPHHHRSGFTGCQTGGRGAVQGGCCCGKHEQQAREQHAPRECEGNEKDTVFLLQPFFRLLLGLWRGLYGLSLKVQVWLTYRSSITQISQYGRLTLPAMDLQKMLDSWSNCNNWSQDYYQSVVIIQKQK